MNFNPIIVLFLTATNVIAVGSQASFQSYYSLISNSQLMDTI